MHLALLELSSWLWGAAQCLHAGLLIKYITYRDDMEAWRTGRSDANVWNTEQYPEPTNQAAVIERNSWLNTGPRSMSDPGSNPSPSAPPSLWQCGTARSSSGGGSRGGSRRWWGCRSPRRWAPPRAWASPRRTRWRAACTGWPEGKQQKIRASSKEEHDADIVLLRLLFLFSK